MSAKPKLKAVVNLRHPIFDHQGRWSSEGIFKPPTDFDAESYQKKLNEIVGVSASGQPICRVSWAWECRKWANTAWDGFGNATKGEWRQRYRALTLEIGNDEYVDISPPRWVLEERFEPGQYERSWESSRYAHIASECRRCINRSVGLIEDSTTCVKRDVHGPAPRDGWYNLVPHIGMVADHERGMRCCERLWKESKEICYGRYRVPDGRELQILRRAIAERNADSEVNPHLELDERALESARIWGQEAMTESKVSTREEAKERWKNEIEVHGAKVCTPFELQALKSLRLRTPKVRDFFH